MYYYTGCSLQDGGPNLGLLFLIFISIHKCKLCPLIFLRQLSIIKNNLIQIYFILEVFIYYLWQTITIPLLLQSRGSVAITLSINIEYLSDFSWSLDSRLRHSSAQKLRTNWLLRS